MGCSTQLVKKIGSVLYVQEHFPQITPAINIYTAYLYDNKEVHILSSAKKKKKIQVSLLFFIIFLSHKTRKFKVVYLCNPLLNVYLEKKIKMKSLCPIGNVKWLQINK